MTLAILPKSAVTARERLLALAADAESQHIPAEELICDSARMELAADIREILEAEQKEPPR